MQEVCALIVDRVMDELDRADMAEMKLNHELKFERARRHEETSLAYRNEVGDARVSDTPGKQACCASPPLFVR